MAEYRYTKVFDVNGHLVIAPNIEDAIKVFKEYDANAEITSIKAVSSYTPNIGDNFNALTLKNKVGYNPYKVVVESISKMFEQPHEKDDLIANIKVKCKDAIEYERKYNDENS